LLFAADEDAKAATAHEAALFGFFEFAAAAGVLLGGEEMVVYY
jgi:hypothetical protein